MQYLKTILQCATLGLMILGMSCSESSKGYTITGSLPADVKVDSLYLYTDDYKKIQGTKLVDGKFEFKGKTDEPAPAVISDTGYQVDIKFILENDKINIALKNKNEAPDITGGKIYNTIYAYKKDPQYKKIMGDYTNYIYNTAEKVDKNNGEEVLKVRDVLNNYEKEMGVIKQKALNEIINNKSNSPTVRVLAYSENRTTEEKTAEHLANLEKMNEEAKNKYISRIIESYKAIAKLEKEAENVEVGKQFIDMTGKDLNGKDVKLSDYVSKNKYTILEFWASWCGPCRAEIPNLKKAYEKYHSKGLEIVSYSIDDKHEEWVKASKEEQQPWINALVSGAFQNESVQKYGIMAIPQSYLIDQNGKILASNIELRDFYLEKTLAKFIK